VKVMYEDILYLEATGNYVTFVLKDNKKVLSRGTFAESINLVPMDSFVRVHRSFFVAINKIDKVERHQVTIGKNAVPVSEAYVAELNAALKK
jgi:two-component system LytT family response regulator